MCFFSIFKKRVSPPIFPTADRNRVSYCMVDSSNRWWSLVGWISLFFKGSICSLPVTRLSHTHPTRSFFSSSHELQSLLTTLTHTPNMPAFRTVYGDWKRPRMTTSLKNPNHLFFRKQNNNARRASSINPYDAWNWISYACLNIIFCNFYKKFVVVFFNPWTKTTTNFLFTCWLPSY